MKNTIAFVIPTKPDEVGQYVISTKCGAAARTEKSIDIPPVISTSVSEWRNLSVRQVNEK